MTQPRIPSDRLDQFREAVREWKGVELSRDEAEEAAMEFLREIRMAAAVELSFRDEGVMGTSEEYQERAEAMFPGYSQRQLRHFRREPDDESS